MTQQNTDKDDSANLYQGNDLFPSDDREQKALEEIYGLLLETSRVDFSKYRDTTVLRRLNRRMGLCRQNNYPGYLRYLKKNPEETQNLFYDLLLSYTHFFRDTHVFDTLNQKVFPKLIEKKSVRRPIKIWVPGCSSGEEVYSMAICLYEFMEDNNIKMPVKIFGTDLVEHHIIKARSGLYNAKIRDEVSKERVERFFDITSEGLRVIKHIREMCVFATQDITQDPPFPNVDLISCRNVMIYFHTAYQDAAIPRFHFSLNPGGFLLLGSSETMGRFPELFDSVDKKSNLYSKCVSTVKPAYHFPVTRKNPKLNIPATASHRDSGARTGSATESAQINSILANAYAPPGVLVDDNLIVRRFIGNPHPYLSPASGEASLKLSRIAGNTLMPDIYTTIQSAKKKNEKIRKKNIVLQNEGQDTYLDICVIPVEDQNKSGPGFLVLFEKAEAPPAACPPPSETYNKDLAEVERLKQELQTTKEQLQSIIEEKDGVNQELWAANEEIMSTNEELQSVNEEMEASKEELESGNEELLALNEELQMKNLAIAESEEKQRLLLQNIHAGVVVHAPDTRIIMANNRACEILGLTIDQMMGKTAMDPAWCFVREDGSPMPLEEYPVNQVIARQEPVRFLGVGINRPQTNDVVWVFAHAYPEMETDGTLREVVVTFLDITERKDLETALRENEQKTKTWIDNSPMCTKIVDPDYNLRFMSASGIRDLRIDDINDFYGKPYPFHFYPDSFKIPMKNNLRKAKKTGEIITQEASVNDIDGNEIWYHSTIVPVNNDQSELEYFMVVSLDITERKQAEEESKRSKTLLKHSFDSLTAHIAVLDHKGNILSVNDSWKSFARANSLVSSNYGIGSNYLTICEQSEGEDAKEAREAFNGIMGVLENRWDGYSLEYPCHSPTEKRWFNLKVTKFGSGDATRIVIAHESITEQKQAEIKLKQNEEKFSKAFNLNPNTLAIIDLETKQRLAVNDYFAELVGYSKKELMENPLGALGEIDLEKAELAINTIKQGRSLKDIEVKLTHRNGNERLMLYSIDGIEIDNRDCMMVSGKDITDRKKAEETKDRILESSIGGIYIYDLSLGKNTYINKQYTVLTGYTLDEISSMTGDEFFSLFHPEDRSRVHEHMRTVIEELPDGRNLHIDYRFKNASGGWKWLSSCDAVYERDESGKVKQFIGTFIDITDKKNLEERLQQSQKMESIGTLAGGIAHDFNNILYPIVGFAEMLKEDLPPDSPEHESAQEIFDAGRRGGELVKQILAFSRQSEHKISPVRIQNILKEALKLSRSTIPSNIEIHEDILQNCGLVMADPTQMHQIVMNLITNAYHAVEDQNGLIDIALKEIKIEENELPHKGFLPGKYVRLSVSDNGIGMAQSTTNKIFEPYFTTKEKGKGTGLGLAVVYGIVKEHKGEIAVYSEVGKGTTFNIYLPLMKKSIEAVLTEQQSKMPIGTERVLLVDDEVSVAKLEAQMLSRLGYQVTAETSSRDALNVFRSNPDSFDLVISDMTMPGMTGDQLSKEILSIKPDTPIIICTGFSERINKEKADQIGVQGFLVKPVVKSEMAKMIRNVLDS